LLNRILITLYEYRLYAWNWIRDICPEIFQYCSWQQ